MAEAVATAVRSDLSSAVPSSPPETCSGEQCYAAITGLTAKATFPVVGVKGMKVSLYF